MHSALRCAFGRGQSISEGKLEPELDFPVALHVTQRAKARISNAPEVRLPGIPLEVDRVLETVEVWMIESIEHLGAELNAVLLSHSPILIDGEIHIIDRLAAN